MHTLGDKPIRTNNQKNLKETAFFSLIMITFGCKKPEVIFRCFKKMIYQ